MVCSAETGVCRAVTAPSAEPVSGDAVVFSPDNSGWHFAPHKRLAANLGGRHRTVTAADYSCGNGAGRYGRFPLLPGVLPVPQGMTHCCLCRRWHNRPGQKGIEDSGEGQVNGDNRLHYPAGFVILQHGDTVFGTGIVALCRAGRVIILEQPLSIVLSPSNPLIIIHLRVITCPCIYSGRVPVIISPDRRTIP